MNAIMVGIGFVVGIMLAPFVIGLFLMVLGVIFSVIASIFK